MIGLQANFAVRRCTNLLVSPFQDSLPRGANFQLSYSKLVRKYVEHWKGSKNESIICLQELPLSPHKGSRHPLALADIENLVNFQCEKESNDLGIPQTCGQCRQKGFKCKYPPGSKMPPRKDFAYTLREHDQSNRYHPAPLEHFGNSSDGDVVLPQNSSEILDINRTPTCVASHASVDDCHIATGSRACKTWGNAQLPYEGNGTTTHPRGKSQQSTSPSGSIQDLQVGKVATGSTDTAMEGHSWYVLPVRKYIRPLMFVMTYQAMSAPAISIAHTMHLKLLSAFH